MTAAQDALSTVTRLATTAALTSTPLHKAIPSIEVTPVGSGRRMTTGRKSDKSFKAMGMRLSASFAHLYDTAVFLGTYADNPKAGAGALVAGTGQFLHGLTGQGSAREFGKQFRQCANHRSNDQGSVCQSTQNRPSDIVRSYRRRYSR